MNDEQVPPADPAPVDEETTVRRPHPSAASSVPAGYVQPDPYVGPPPVAPAPAPGYQPSRYAYTPTPPQGLAITSMVLGIVGVFTVACWFIGLALGIAAVITGHAALKRQRHAKAFAIAGLVTGYFSVVVALLLGVAAIGWILFPVASGY